MNITKQIIKKSVLVGTIALSIAVFAGCSDSANSSTADTTKPTEAQTTVQATALQNPVRRMNRLT